MKAEELNKTTIPNDESRHTSNNTKYKTIIEHKIGKVTYIVEASYSDAAKDTIDRKVEMLIMRDCARMQK